MKSFIKILLELFLVGLTLYIVLHYTILTPVTQILRVVLVLAGLIHIINTGIKHTT